MCVCVFFFRVIAFFLVPRRATMDSSCLVAYIVVGVWVWSGCVGVVALCRLHAFGVSFHFILVGYVAVSL